MRRLRPRVTVRLRLTALYGVLFFVSGAAVLAMTYALVDRAGSVSAEVVIRDAPAPAELGPSDRIPSVTQQLVEEVAAKQHSNLMHLLLVRSSIALAVTGVASVGLGWVVAGRVLRPLRSIAAVTRQITSENLHQRLEHDGPRDELTDLGDTINGLLARLDAAFEAQRRFVAHASHELRTPLARQRTVAQVALADPEATVESLRVAHERVLAAGEQQERLIEALLTLARGESALRTTESIDLATLAERVATLRADDLAARSLQVETALRPAATEGDANLLERVVSNLVDNAIRHNRPGGIVRVATGVRDGQTRLTISNSGPIVPPEHVDQLFQPFHRLDPNRNAKGDGVGLGLSIVKAISDLHGADVRIRAHPDGGLTVEVVFAPAGRGRRAQRF